MGWDEYFLRRGHPVYVIDQAWRGRSAAEPRGHQHGQGRQGPAERLPQVFSAGHEPAWAIFRFGPQYPRPFPACSSRSRRRPSSGSRWCRTGRLAAHAQPHGARPVGAGPATRRHRAAQPLPGRHLPVPGRGAGPHGGRRHRRAGAGRLPGGDRRHDALSRACRSWCCGATTSTSRRAGRPAWRSAAPSCGRRTPPAARPSWCCCPTWGCTATRT